MYPDSFDYHRADSVTEALSMLEEHADATVLSGGHSLVPTMKSGLRSPEAVVDIGEIDEITGIERTDEGLHIGACTRYGTVTDDERVRRHAPALAAAAGEIGDTQVRNRGTVGGNIAHADPASDLPATMLATGAKVHARGPDGHRTIDADEFFRAIYTTALEHDEILTGIDVPSIGSGAGAYAKKVSPSSGYAVVGVAARIRTDGGRITEAGVAANGVTDHAVRLAGVEDALEGENPGEGAIEVATERATEGIDRGEILEDLQADREYRAQLLRSYTKRALRTAFERL